MSKNILKENIKSVRVIANRIPKSINEAISFESNDMDMEEPMDASMEEPMEGPHKMPSHDSGPNIENFISNMRKESLGIMKALADNPDDAVYQFAKKIFQLADKAHEDQKEGRDINGQPKNGQMHSNHEMM